MDDEKKHKLYSDIYDDSMWLINLMENLLSITRIENGTMNITMRSELLQEVIDEALLHINRRRTQYQITTKFEDDLLMVTLRKKSKWILPILCTFKPM